MQNTWQELIHGDAFYCAVCKKIPATSLWISSDEKNVCNNCYENEREKYTGAIRNAALNWIIEKMSFPCVYRDLGCGKVLMYGRYHEHVSECPHRQTYCVIGECPWVGSRQQLMMHLFEDHPDSTISEVDGAFPIPCSVDVLDTRYFIQTKAGRVILGMKTDSDMLRIVIYSSDEFEPSTGQFILQYRTGPSSIAQHVCTVSNDIDCLTRFNSDYTTEMNVDKKLNASVHLVYKPEKPPIPKQLVKYFSCYDCHKITATNWECDEGHQVCNNCSSNTGHQCFTGILEEDSLIKIIANGINCDGCGMTRGTLSGYDTYLCDDCQTTNRNTYKDVKVRTIHVLNNFIDEFEFPCCFEAQGCKFIGPVPRNHEATCEYFRVTCPVSGCHNNYCYSKLLNHMTQNHYGSCAVQDRLQLVLSLNLHKRIGRFFLICFNRIFNFTLEVVNLTENVYSTRWTVQEVSGRSNRNFLFTVDITGSMSLSMTYVCGDTLPLDFDLLHEFANEGQVQYSIKITEKA